MADSKLMTVKEVAELYQVDPRTVSRWVKFGILKAVRLKRLGIFGRGTLRFERREVLKVHEQSEAGGGPGLGAVRRRASGGGAGGGDTVTGRQGDDEAMR